MALAMKPALLLLDEPGSQLDYATKWDVQLLIQKIAQSRGLAGICVTHDLEEAVFLGDRVMVLNGGHVANLIDISLPRPRNNEIRTSKEFIAYRHQLMGHHSAST
jgi:NitT/TauT family transport system ATP-binding protein